MTRIDGAFKESELVGFFRWNPDLTDELRANDPWFYSAMHEKRLRTAIRRGRLTPRGSFDVIVNGERIGQSCSWLALEDWHSYKGCNHFGPFVVRIKLRELDGRRFYVFRRITGEWRRVYFVQREEKTALFDTPAERIDPRTLFKREHGVLMPRTLTQYEVLLTESVSLARAKVEATAHTWCASNSEHCFEKLDRHDAIERLSDILGHELMPPGVRMFPRPFLLRHVIPARQTSR